jgi:hypothetical protein
MGTADPPFSDEFLDDNPGYSARTGGLGTAGENLLVERRGPTLR